MSQLVACRAAEGVVIAADRQVVLEQGGEVRTRTIRKLFPLGPGAVVATSGAAVGIWVSRTLSHLLRRRGALPFEDLEAYVLQVFQNEYDQFVHQGASWFAANPQAHRLSYILLAARNGAGSHLFRFYASEAHGDPYRALPTGDVLTAPRRLGLEARLLQGITAGLPLESLAGRAAEGLRTIASREDSVAGPFDIALVGEAGTRFEVCAP